MKNILKIAIFTMLLAACGNSHENGAQLAASETDVCNKQDIPAGWVIVGHPGSMSCKNAAFGKEFAYKIKPATEQTEIVCADSPIPAGYARVESRNHMPCSFPFTPDSGDNARVIRRL